MRRKRKRGGIGGAFRGLHAVVSVLLALVGIAAVGGLIFAFVKFFQG